MTKFPKLSGADLLVHERPELKTLHTRRQLQTAFSRLAKRLSLVRPSRPREKEYSNFQILQWAKERAKQ